MNAPTRDFRHLIQISDFNSIEPSTVEELILAGMREPLTELLGYYKKQDYITKMSDTFSYIFHEIIKRAAQKNAYPAFLLPRLLDYPEFICSFIEGFEKYLYNLRFSYANNIIYFDSIPGVDLELSIKDKLYIFQHSDQEIIGLNAYGKRMYFEFSPSKQAEILLDQYRNLYKHSRKCKNKCSSNLSYCK